MMSRERVLCGCGYTDGDARSAAKHRIREACRGPLEKAVGERLEERAGLVERRAVAEERYFKAPHDTAEEAGAEAEMEAEEAAIEKLDEAVARAKEEARKEDLAAAQAESDAFFEVEAKAAALAAAEAERGMESE